MQTLPNHLRKLVTENQKGIRDALRQLREGQQEQARVRTSRGEEVVIKTINPEPSNSSDSPAKPAK